MTMPKGRRAENTTHMDNDVLAEFRAGLITGRRGAKIAAHLAGCDRCTAIDGELAGVSALLASVPAPAMPDSVAQRLDAVLATEVARRDYPERSRRDSSRETPVHDRRAGHRDFRFMSLRVLAPAAAVVLAAGGYGLSQIVRGPGNQREASSPAAGAAQANSGAKSASRASASAGPFIPAPTAGSRKISTTLPVVNSPVSLSRATLKQQVQDELGVAPASRTTQAASPLVRACVQGVAGNALVLLVESVHFGGQPATVIVTRTGQKDTVWVEGAGCSGTSSDQLDMLTLP